MSYKHHSALLFLLVLAACGQPTAEEKLQNLKKKEADLKKEIALLEKQVNKTDTAAKKMKSVVVTAIRDSVFEHYIDIQGAVDARENVNVSSKVPGVITAIYVKEGQNVSKGQTLAQVDDQILRANMAELRTQLDLATTLYQKQQNLWKQQIGSEVQYLNAKNQKESLERKMATLNDQLSQAKIVSPINGSVDAVISKLGDNAAPGSTSFRVVNSANLRVLANVAEAYAGAVKTGDPVVVAFPDIDKELRTKIGFAAKAIDPVSRTIRVEVPMPNDAALRPNMIAQIKIIDYSTPHALVIPVNVIQYALGKSYVIVAEKSKDGLIAKRREVEVGRTYNDKAEIKSGLQAGENVVTTGYQGLNDNDLIQL
ncbi:efflux RND transporter periplasmic adaptor subunit [Chitinophaga sancti]|uniref:Efflux RND transporter periplasmic adaptor subunit n=1 Tax=Chitinophaga sancti TaxID=1004 RepID=A0A1K1STI9_9BACT|nr:efflux RND transporter periplasmic adaptor subunit [Chitinophaga sancti]WQD60859.1 efflux RND transporter periplasmic adaptor subunit [Chitinophaga sancti]WQG87013.1 efflux RND transporter periplasmic adaptor subunit [Chitinophaga sancti]SFW87548.1 RND family efflux transporter, MFP subunit [Chitinophaga sancti]